MQQNPEECQFGSCSKGEKKAEVLHSMLHMASFLLDYKSSFRQCAEAESPKSLTEAIFLGFTKSPKDPPALFLMRRQTLSKPASILQPCGCS